MAKERITSLDKQLQKSAFGIVATVLIAIYSIALVVPLLWALMTAMKDKLDFIFNPIGLPDPAFGWHPENFITAFEKAFIVVYDSKTGAQRVAYLPEMFMWAFVFATGTTIVNEVSRCCCAYIMAKYRKYWLPRLMHNTIIVLMVIPLMGSLGSSLIIYKAVGIYDNMIMWFLFAFGFTGGNALIYYASFRGVSWGYAEAAFIDGANNYTVMFKIMMPMIRPIFLAHMLLTFKAFWNDYSTPMIYLPSYPTVAYGLFKFKNSGDNAVTIPVQMAASVMVAAPIIAMYITFRHQLIGSMSIGGLKG